MSGERDQLHIDKLSHGDVALLKQVAKEAAKETVREFSTAMGIDPDKPFDAQQDMQWVRKTRERSEGIVGKAIMTAVAIAVAGALSTFWTGAKAILIASASAPPPGH